MEKQWLKYDVVICDELGYVPFAKMGAELLLQFFSSRQESKSVILTTNPDFREWMRLCGDEKMTVALLDRLTHRTHMLLMNEESYRFRQTLSIQEMSSERVIGKYTHSSSQGVKQKTKDTGSPEPHTGSLSN